MEITEKVSISIAKDICKIGQGEVCCRYLICGANGFECAKGTDTGRFLDSRVTKGTITAKGDNCEGAKIMISNRIIANMKGRG